MQATTLNISSNLSLEAHHFHYSFPNEHSMIKYLKYKEGHTERTIINRVVSRGKTSRVEHHCLLIETYLKIIRLTCATTLVGWY